MKGGVGGDYERRTNDQYWTPAWVTRCLLRRFNPIGTIWEPAAGRGDMVDAMLGLGNGIHATDIDLQPYHESLQGAVRQRLLTWDRWDFYVDPPFKYGSIITNPPYKNLDKWLERGLDLVERGSQLALLLSMQHLGSDRRARFFQHAAFRELIIINKRIRWIEGSKAAPYHNHVWAIWDPHTCEYPPMVSFTSDRKSLVQR